MSNKQILFLLDDIWPLGKNKGVSSLYMLLDKSCRDFNCFIMTTDQNNYNDELNKCDINHFKKLRFNSSSKYINYFVSQISFLLLNFKYFLSGVSSKLKPDIIYVSSSVPVIAGYLLGKYYGCKVIHRIYGTFLFSGLENKINKIKKWQEVLSFLVHADRYVITNDGTSGDRVARYFNIPESKICFWRNGINKVQVTNDERISIRNRIIEECALPDDAFLVLSVSRLASWKKVDRSIKAMNGINDSRIYLLVIGDGDSAESYKNMSSNSNTLFLGAKTRQEVQDYMLASDLFVSMYDVSNIGNPLLEAFAVGLPIITYNSGSTKEVVDGNNAILIEATDENEIISALQYNILNLRGDKELRVRLSSNAREYSDNNLMSWDQRIDAEMNVFRKLVQ